MEISKVLCPRPQSLVIADNPSLALALSLNGKLHCVSLESDGPENSIVIASSVTSFTLTPDFLIYITSSQTSHYVPMSDLRRIAALEEEVTSHWETRRVERGALCVTACPSSMSLVLQMPRGNLETIYPRALVLAVVRRDVDAYVVIFFAIGQVLIATQWCISFGVHRLSETSS